MALPREQRLKNARDFRSVSRAGAKERSGKLLLRARAGRQGSSRFGVVVSKKVAKNAAERNRMKRLLAEALKAEQGSLKKPCDVVLIALPGFSPQNLKEARETVRELFSKSSL